MEPVSPDRTKARRVLLVGGFPPPGKRIFGGNVTDGQVLLQSSFVDRFDVQVLDSTQRSNPAPGLLVRAAIAACRLSAFAGRLITWRPSAVILFMATGGSVIEKGAMAWMSRMCGVAAIVYPGAGALIQAAEKSVVNRWTVKVCLLGARMVICQGPEWRRFVTSTIGFPLGRSPILNNFTATREVVAVGKARDLATARDPVCVCFLGWLERSKGVFELLDACKRLSGRHRFVLRLAGRGHAEAEARAFVAREGLTHIVKFEGWVSGQAKLDLLAEADVLALPSWAEGFPNVVVEAMAAKLAVVVTSVGNIPAILIHEQHALIVPPRDTSALERAIEKLIVDSEFRCAMAERAHAFACARFETERGVERLSAIVGCAIDRRDFAEEAAEVRA